MTDVNVEASAMEGIGSRKTATAFVAATPHPSPRRDYIAGEEPECNASGGNKTKAKYWWRLHLNESMEKL